MMAELCDVCAKTFSCKGKELLDFLQSCSSQRQKEGRAIVLEKGEARIDYPLLQRG